MARLDPVDRPAAIWCGNGDSEASVYRDRARRLGLPFAPMVYLDPGTPVDPAAIRRGSFVVSAEADRPAFIAPDDAALPKVADWLATYPGARKHLSVATPSSIRQALIDVNAAAFAAEAVCRLARTFPDLSAHRVVTVRQLAVGLATVASVGIALHAAPFATLVVLNLTSALFFFAVSALRFVAAAIASRRGACGGGILAATEPSPVYTVLVPLFHEAKLVKDLVAALDRLDWPHDRLDIKLIVEATDPITVAAARAAVSGPPYEVIVVPAVGPQTKPKALTFALQFARGDFVTVYDAEDRPHPQQMREAYAAFSRSAPDLACLQSPILIDGRTSVLERLFAVEYAALFDGLLPGLAALGLPLPLGGTSNHFRRQALERVGGWDPFNVTEDADIGLRLARFGYRVATLELPTLEEAPATLRPWLKQRTRWFKGWMQTWLVHVRRPMRCLRELGWQGFLGFNLIGTGLIVSALVHPVYLATVAAILTDPLSLWRGGGVLTSAVIGVNLFNLFAGYAALAVLAVHAAALRKRTVEPHLLMLLPVYLLLMSLASYRALAHLLFKPHHWEKTPHRGQRPTAIEPFPRSPIHLDRVRQQKAASEGRNRPENSIRLDDAFDWLAKAQRQRQLQTALIDRTGAVPARPTRLRPPMPERKPHRRPALGEGAQRQWQLQAGHRGQGVGRSPWPTGLSSPAGTAKHRY